MDLLSVDLNNIKLDDTNYDEDDPEVDLNNIKLDDTNYDEDDPEAIIHIRVLAFHTKFEKREALKKDINKELMLVVWHSRRWWNFCMSEDEKKEIEPIITEQCF